MITAYPARRYRSVRGTLYAAAAARGEPKLARRLGAGVRNIAIALGLQSFGLNWGLLQGTVLNRKRCSLP